MSKMGANGCAHTKIDTGSHAAKAYLPFLPGGANTPQLRDQNVAHFVDGTRDFRI